MSITPCQSCKFGAIVEGFSTGDVKSIYVCRIASKVKNGKLKEINYKENDYGCRMSQWNDKEEKCIANGFSEYEMFQVTDKSIAVEATFADLGDLKNADDLKNEIENEKQLN